MRIATSKYKAVSVCTTKTRSKFRFMKIGSLNLVRYFIAYWSFMSTTSCNQNGERDKYQSWFDSFGCKKNHSRGCWTATEKDSNCINIENVTTCTIDFYTCCVELRVFRSQRFFTRWKIEFVGESVKLLTSVRTILVDIHAKNETPENCKSTNLK